MTDSKAIIVENLINEQERELLETLHNLIDWRHCMFCHDSTPATHETSSGDYVCRDCYMGFEGYMQGAFGECETCNHSLHEGGRCTNCEYQEWHRENGVCKVCGNDLEFSSKPDTEFWIPCKCEEQTA